MSFMFKHLKSYQLFESLKDEYETKLREIKLQETNLLLDTKKQVDEYMYYILDDYQKDNSEDEVKDNGRSFVIVYKNINCKLNCLDNDWTEYDKFISLVEKVSERIKKEFEVSVKLKASLLYEASRPMAYRQTHRHDIYNYAVTIDKVKEYIKLVKNSQREARPDYHTLEVEIIVS